MDKSLNELETKGYSLVTLRDAMNDIDKQIEITNYFRSMDELFNKYLGINIKNSYNEASSEVERILAREVDGTRKYFMVKHEDKLIGIFYVYEYKRDFNKCNLALGLSKEYRGKGIADILMEYMCKQLITHGITRIGLEIESDNIYSLKSVTKLQSNLGFEREGISRNHYGIGRDCIIYSLIVKKQERS